MIVTTDETGRYLGHLDAGYPAPADMLERVRASGSGLAYDVPPFTPDFWYFPDGVPTVRPKLDYQAAEATVDGEKATRLTGIPAGVTVEVRGPEGAATVETDDEPLDLLLRTTGEYRVAFEAFPYQPVSLLITVTGGTNGAA